MRLEMTTGSATRVLLAVRDTARTEDLLQLVERLASLAAAPARYALVTPAGVRLWRDAPWIWHAPGISARDVDTLRAGSVAALAHHVDTRRALAHRSAA